MEPSSNSSGATADTARRLGAWDSTSLGTWLDRVALGGLIVGLAGYVMPWWAHGRLKWAFLLTLSSTVLHVFTSRRGSQDAEGQS